MAFTTIKGHDGNPNVVLGVGSGGAWEPYFHETDVNLVQGQAGARGVLLVRAEVGRDVFNGVVVDRKRECFVLVGIRVEPGVIIGVGEEATINEDLMLIADNHFAAIPCPPFNHDELELLDDSASALNAADKATYLVGLGLPTTPDKIKELAPAVGF